MTAKRIGQMEVAAISAPAVSGREEERRLELL
jgi:hypothetical protein